MNWYRKLNMASVAVGFTSLGIGALVSSGVLSATHAKPVVLVCVFAIFPIFGAFVIQGAFANNEEEEKAELSIENLRKSLIKALKEWGAVWFSVLEALVLFVGGLLLWDQIEVKNISYAFGEPFERVHAIGLSAAACIFMAPSILGFSLKGTSIFRVSDTAKPRQHPCQRGLAGIPI